MRIIEDVQWHRDAAQCGAAPAPEPGEQRTVWLPQADLHPEGDQQLLWVPLYSELNGWDSQPSDIARSHIVTARLTRTARAPTGTAVECTAAIQARINLVVACHNRALDIDGDSLLLANLQSVVFWDQVRWAGTSSAGGLKFLDVVAGEAAMSILFTDAPDPCSVRYAQFSMAGSSTAALGCWPLQGGVLRAIERHMAAAVRLSDTATP
jgi:hypothetical protein